MMILPPHPTRAHRHGSGRTIMHHGPGKPLIRTLRISAAIASVAAACLTATMALAKSEGIKTVVLCPDAYGNTVDYVKPKKCSFANADYFNRAGIRSTSPGSSGATASSAGSIYVIHMHWRHWGSNVARASGTYAGNMNYRAHAIVRLSRPDRCSHLPEKVYSRFWIKIGNSDPVSYPLEGCV